MTTTMRPLTELTAAAIQLLFKEMGVVNTLRFLNQFSTGFGNYTTERDALFRDMSVDDIVAEIKRTTTTHDP
ncbi:MAG TPA: hypothetical protein PKA05_23235 [Roseiflexaceae bacterium]|mgnify:FL=1|nr:hypothetical protein [Roseiflexaceae bacterium]HMP43307.1 hypothetical protein [Roseiflexaceae bacterium]